MQSTKPPYTSIRSVPAGTILGNSSGATAAAQALDASTVRTVIGLGTAATAATGDFAAATHSHASTSITDFAEAARDAIGAALVAGTNITITVNDAADTITVAASGGSPGGSSGQIQYNNAGAFGGAAGAVWSASSPNFTITAQASAHTALRAAGAASHGATTPIFDVVNSSDTRLFAVLPSRVIVGPDGTLDFPTSTDGSGATGRNTIRASYGAMYFRCENKDNLHLSAGLLKVGGGGSNNTIQNFDRGGSLTLSVVDHYGGTNISGQPLKLCTGRSTGNALPGTIDLQVSPPGASGSSFNTLTTVAQVDGSTTSGGTRFLLWDIDAGSLKRVFLGANDSGGTGYKILRVAN